jgi:hypothetical protein
LARSFNHAIRGSLLRARRSIITLLAEIVAWTGEALEPGRCGP